MKARVLAGGLLLWSGFAPPCRGAGAGTTSADFLNIGLGGRAVAMGGAFVAVADDVSAIYWNPAGLPQLLQREAGFVHTQWLQGVSYENVSYAHPLRQGGALGLSYSLLQKKSIAGYDETGRDTGALSVSASAATVAWGQTVITDILSLGASGKWLREDLAGYTANGYAADAGALLSFYRNTRFQMTAGLALRHLGSQSAFAAEKGKLPTTMTAGLGLRTTDERLRVALDVVRTTERSMPNPAFGGEYWIHPIVAVRAGYKHGADAGRGFSAGAGFRVKSFQFDYAATDLGELGLAHQGGITFKFGGETENYYQEGLELMQQGQYAEAFLKFNRILTARPNDRRIIRKMKECKEHIKDELEGLKPPPAKP